MTKAGLNTLMGMGTVFAVLILIAVLISCFNFIPKIQAVFSKKEKKAEAAADNAVAQIVENEAVQEEDDLELVAVIAAAIAAYEGSASTDGFTVRSIRKVNSKWKNNR
jgi:sodium pump decarboxylase gamma subunit